MKTRIEYHAENVYFPFAVYFYSTKAKEWIRHKTLNNLQLAREIALDLSKGAEEIKPIYFEDGKEVDL